jgi:hypothetical protein
MAKLKFPKLATARNWNTVGKLHESARLISVRCSAGFNTGKRKLSRPDALRHSPALSHRR